MGLTIRKRFISIFIIFIFIPIIIICLLFSFIYEVKIEERFVNEQRVILTSLNKDVIDKSITDMEELLIVISNNTDLYRVFDDDHLSSDILKQWDNYREIYPERAWIYYGSNSGELFISPYWDAPDGYNLLLRPWYISGEGSSSVKWTEPYVEYISHDIILSASIGIKNSKNEFTGVLSIDTTIRDIFNLLKSEAQNKKSELYVITQEGIPVSLNNKRLQTNSSFNWAHYLNTNNREKLIKVDDQFFYHQEIYIPKLQLYLVSLLPENVVEEEVRPVLFLIYLILLLGLTSTVTAGLLMSKNIIQKIISTQKYISEIARGNYSNRTVSESNDDFSSLNNDLNRLVLTISDQIQELKKVNSELDENVKKKEELVELRTSLIHLLSHNSASPITILYNITLQLLRKDQSNSNYKMIHTASKNLKSLNENIMAFIKLDEGLFSNNTEIVKLKDLTEVLLNNYSYQYSEKNISITVNCIQNINIETNYFIIKMILENLLDNAIKYSLINSSISIKTYCDDQSIYWELEDGGPGFSNEDRVVLFGKFQKLSARPTGGESSMGLGLFLVKQLAEIIGAEIILINKTSIHGTKFIVKADNVFL